MKPPVADTGCDLGQPVWGRARPGREQRTCGPGDRVCDFAERIGCKQVQLVKVWRTRSQGHHEGAMRLHRAPDAAERNRLDRGASITTTPLSQSSQNPRRDAGHQRGRRHIRSHDGSGRDDGASSDCDARQDRGGGSDPDIRTDGDGSGGDVVASLVWLYGVSRGDQVYFVGEHHVVADIDGGVSGERALRADEHAPTDADVKAVVRVEGGISVKPSPTVLPMSSSTILVIASGSSNEQVSNSDESRVATLTRSKRARDSVVLVAIH